MCPDHRPFCSPIGCVVECPANDVINGSNCLMSCNEWFIGENRKCQVDCPADHFIEEKTVRNGDTYSTERHCVRLCDPVSFVYNRTCFPLCPPEAQYLDGKHCIKKCPDEKNILSKLSLDDKYISCENVCRSNVFEKGVCVRYCEANRFVFNTTCVNVCPAEANLLSFDGPHTICKSQCDRGRVIQNRTCVEYCSENEFVYNGSCVSRCPQDKPLMKEGNVVYCASCKTKFLKNTYCVERCPDDMLVHHAKCVMYCPSGLVVHNSSCISECPQQQPVAVKESDSYRTRFNCKTTCDNTDECLCPIERPYLQNGTCHVTCPPGSNITRNYTYTQGCVDKCNSNEFIYDGRCVASCPHYANFVYNLQCVNDCPTLYIQDTSNSHIYNQCVDQCPSSTQFIYKKACVIICPSDQKYVYNFTCTDICPTKYTDENSNYCVEECESGKYIYNDSVCLATCPSTYNYILNKTCSNSNCSTKFRYIHKASANVECVDKCPAGTFINNTYDCVHQCLHFLSKCVDTCPEDAPYMEHVQDKGVECKALCSYSLFLNSDICNESCPMNMPYKNGNECLDQCPSTTRAIKTELITNRKHCVEKCGDGYVILNKTCVFELVCNGPYIVFGDECLIECPVGYVLGGKLGCVDIRIIGIIMAGLCSVVLSVLALNRRNFRDFLSYTMYVVISCQEEPFEFDIPNEGTEEEKVNENFNMNKDTEPILELEDIRNETRNVEQVVEDDVADTKV